MSNVILTEQVRRGRRETKLTQPKAIGTVTRFSGHSNRVPKSIRVADSS